MSLKPLGIYKKKEYDFIPASQCSLYILLHNNLIYSFGERQIRMCISKPTTSANLANSDSTELCIDLCLILQIFGLNRLLAINQLNVYHSSNAVLLDFLWQLALTTYDVMVIWSRKIFNRHEHCTKIWTAHVYWISFERYRFT